MSALRKVLTMPPTQVYLDIKYARNPEVKFPIVILPAIQGLEEEHPTYGFAWSGGTSFLQSPTAQGPSSLQPTYQTYGMSPSLTGSQVKS